MASRERRPAERGPVTIVGGSTRAAAWSAIRAGFEPYCLDLFADRDLSAWATVRLVPGDEFPLGIIRRLAEWPSRPLVYVGPLENAPGIVERLGKRSRLWGNDGPVLRRVRDPLDWSEALSRAGIAVPRVELGRENVQADGRWMVKPRASAGGVGVGVFVGQETRGQVYFQERIEGFSYGAQFLATPTGCTFLGAVHQRIGAPGAPGEFVYSGSIGPCDFATVEFQAIGDRVWSSLGLRGLFGVDVVEDSSGVLWPVEINPRYTAAVEILERASGESLFGRHVDAFLDDSTLPIQAPPPRACGTLHGKAILFAASPFTWEEEFGPDGEEFDSAIPSVADVPWPGTVFRAGDPVLTVFASAPSHDEVRRKLEASLQEWSARISPR